MRKRLNMSLGRFWILNLAAAPKKAQKMSLNEFLGDNGSYLLYTPHATVLTVL